MLAVEESPLIKGGTLSKRGSGWLKRWTKRYWELRSDGYLSYFTNSKNTAVRRGLVDVKHNLKCVLAGREAVEYGGGSWPKQSEDAFLALVTEDRVYCLMADDGYECQDWVQGLAMFVKVNPSALKGISADQHQNGFHGNGGALKGKNNQVAMTEIDGYDALNGSGEGDWEDDPGPGEFDIVYDSPIRDTTLRPESTKAINVSNKRSKPNRRQPVASIQESSEFADEYEEYEVDRDSKKTKKKKKESPASKLPRLPSRFSRKRQNSLRASKHRKDLPPLPLKPGKSSGGVLGNGGGGHLPEPVPRRPRGAPAPPPKGGRQSATPPPPPQPPVKNTAPGLWRGKSNKPTATTTTTAAKAEPTPVPRRRGTPPGKHEQAQAPTKQHSATKQKGKGGGGSSGGSKMYANNKIAAARSGPPPPPPPPSRGRHGSMSEGSGSSGDVFLSQPKLIGRKGKGSGQGAVPAKKKR